MTKLYNAMQFINIHRQIEKLETILLTCKYAYIKKLVVLVFSYYHFINLLKFVEMHKQKPT